MPLAGENKVNSSLPLNRTVSSVKSPSGTSNNTTAYNSVPTAGSNAFNGDTQTLDTAFVAATGGWGSDDFASFIASPNVVNPPNHKRMLADITLGQVSPPADALHSKTTDREVLTTATGLVQQIDGLWMSLSTTGVVDPPSLNFTHKQQVSGSGDLSIPNPRKHPSRVYHYRLGSGITEKSLPIQTT